MAQFRATIESDSPAKVASRLVEAGYTLLGPWAAGLGHKAKALGLAEELDVPVLLEAQNSSAAADQLRQIVGSDAEIQVLRVVAADADD